MFSLRHCFFERWTFRISNLALQQFPAIRIVENEVFSRSSQYNPYIKRQKNVFRFFLVAVEG